MKQIFIYLMMALSLSACKNEYVILDEFIAVKNEIWDWEDTKEFGIILKEKDFTYDVFINLRITTDYEYENLFLLLYITNPQGKTNKEVVQLQLSESDGKWLGTISGGMVSFRIPIQNKFPMATPGKWKFTLEQHMREKQLPDLNSIGLHIVKQSKIF